MQEKIDKLNTALKYSEQSTTSAQMTLESLRADLQRKENQITNDQHSHNEETSKFDEKIKQLRTQNESLKDEI